MSRTRPLMTYDEALALALAAVSPLGQAPVSLAAARGRVLRKDVVADRDQPPFDRSAMDGLAVRSAEVQPEATFPIVGVIAAGAGPDAYLPELPAGSVKRIATGAPLPTGADAVVPIEQSRDDGREASFLVDQVAAWKNVHRRGSDARAGDVVLKRGTRLMPQHIGMAAAVGADTLEVSIQPRITLLSTGDEVRPPQTATDDLEPQQIRNSNGPMLRALLASLLASDEPLLDHVHVADEQEQTVAAAREALSHSHLVVTIGGVSVGQRDWLPRAWERLGLQTIVHGVAIQPGKPVLVAATPERDDGGLVIGLPGNPVSVLATAHLFLWPMLRKMLGQSPTLPWRKATLAEPIRASGKRQVFRAAVQEPDGPVRVVQWQGSGDLMHTGVADGWVRLPITDEAVEAGTEVAYLPMVG